MTALRWFRVGVALLCTLGTCVVALSQPKKLPPPRPILPRPDADKSAVKYHGINVGDVDRKKGKGSTGKSAAPDDSGTPKSALQQAVDPYLKAVKRERLAWVAFTQEISNPLDAKQAAFPADNCKDVGSYWAIPFINLVTPGPGEILEGNEKNGWKLRQAWTEALTTWGAGAGTFVARTGTFQQALIVCWGAGCNGDSSCWKNHPREFKDAYKAIQDTVTKAASKGATIDVSDRICWVFQLQVPDGVNRRGNKAYFEDFYPVPSLAELAKAVKDAENAVTKAQSDKDTADTLKGDTNKKLKSAMEQAKDAKTDEEKDKAIKAVIETTKAAKTAADAVDAAQEGLKRAVDAEKSLKDAASKKRSPPFVDWIGVSLFGTPGGSTSDSGGNASATADDSSGGQSGKSKVTLIPLNSQFDLYYDRIVNLDSTRRIVFAAFGCQDTTDIKSALWARDALRTLTGEDPRFPKVIGFSWYNSIAAPSYCAAEAAGSSGSKGVSLQVEQNSIVAGVFPHYLDLRTVRHFWSFKRSTPRVEAKPKK
jgi:hypothetical protein